ncbi:surface-adhesin E family protein [Cupriavidus basilensis]
MSLRALFHAAAVLIGSSICLAAYAEPVTATVRPAAAGLYECQAPNGGTVFRSTPREGCAMVAAPDPSAPDPQRWLPLMGANGVVSYFDKSSVRRRGPEVGVAVMRNAPAGVIRTASGEPIRSSLRRMVFNCATSMYAVVEQTLYAKRYARGESLYTISAPQAGMPQPANAGTVAGELLGRLCH